MVSYVSVGTRQQDAIKTNVYEQNENETRMYVYEEIPYHIIIYIISIRNSSFGLLLALSM